MQTNPKIFQNNMTSLQKHYPDLALMLNLVKIEHHELVQHENCLPNVLVNKEFYYVGNVIDFCEEQFKGFELSNVKIPVFLGMGLGYEVMYWMQHKSKEFKSQAMIIFEKDPELFMCAMNVTDLRPIIENPNIHLFVGVPLNSLYVLLRNHFSVHLQETLMCGTMQPVFTFQSMKNNKEYYLHALQIMYESIYHCIQNHGNCPEDSLIGLENMLDNVGQIVNNPGINLLYDKFKDKPAVIVATGPSLKKNMHLLKDLEDKALIISVDASFKHLMKHGIKPHMVTSLEREHEVQQFFDNFEPEKVKDIYMTACPVLFNHVYESYNGPQIIVYRNFDHFKWLEIDRGILEIKLSSSNMAFKIAEALGCNPIILIGQDLAYGENNETHVTEVPFSSEGEGIFYVKGNCQEKVKTNSGWYNFLKAYELDIAQFISKSNQGMNIYQIPEPVLLSLKESMKKDTNIDQETKDKLIALIDSYMSKPEFLDKTVINCTEGGAYIQGTQIAKFDETIEKYATEIFNPLDIIKSNLSQFKTAESDTGKLKEIIEKTEIEVREIINNCIKGVETCKKYEEELKTDLETEKLQEIRQEIILPRLEIQEKYNNTFQKFLMHVVQSYHLKFEMESVMNITDSKDLLIKFSEWYSFIGDISEICLQSLIKAKGKLYGIQNS